MLNLIKNIQYSNQNIYANINSNTSSIFIKPVSSIEIENIVYNCDSKYSTDSHDFNFFVIRKIILSVSNMLSIYLINALEMVFTLMYLKHLKSFYIKMEIKMIAQIIGQYH